MARVAKRDIVKAVLERYPKSQAAELGIRIERNTPAPLYQWLLASLLFSARISGDQAVKAMRALLDQGWRTPRKMAGTTWRERVTVLNQAGYARYDESTATYIADTTDFLLKRYRGDLRQLREAAACKPAIERKLIKDFKGIGDVGVDIFFREAQVVWDEIYPFADRKALRAAQNLQLAADAPGLARLVDQADLPRLLSGLVQLSNEKIENPAELVG